MTEKLDKTNVFADGEKSSVDDTRANISNTKDINDTQGNSSASAASSTARPITRSQTGRVAKRRLPDDSAAEPKKRSSSSRKKQKSTPKSTSDAEEQVEADHMDPQAMPPMRRATSEATPESDVPGLSTSRITFLEVSAVAGDQGERRMSRTRAFFPTPVPNLTKKSRGRRVPTTQAEDQASAQPEKRLYVCKVEGCGKCFHRGEHLKRHIRSIHTHEKPFKCTFHQCEKFFNRHDNLLQHLKVHKDSKPEDSEDHPNSTSRPNTPPPSVIHQQEPDSPASEAPDSPVIMARPRTIYDHTPSLYTGYSNSAPFESPAEPMRFVTNMAVSSLRTEIPQSPTESRSAGYQWHRSEYSKDQLTY